MARPSPSRRPRCSRSAGLSTCGAIPRRSRRSGAPRMQRGRRATFPMRLQIAALSALTQLESGDGARRALETLRGSLDESATGGRRASSSSCCAASRRACSSPRASVTKQSRSRATLPAAQRAAPSRRGRRSCTPTLRRARTPRPACRGRLVHDGPRHAHRGARPAAVARHAQLDHDGARASLERALELAGSDRFPRCSCRPARRCATCSRDRFATARATAGSSRSCASCSTAARSAGRSADHTAARAAQQARADRARLPRDHAVERGDRGRAVPLDEHHQDPHEEHLPQARRHAQASRGLPGTQP